MSFSQFNEPLVRSSTLFLCGGGTGGHVYPALAVAETLEKQRVFDAAKAKSLELQTKDDASGSRQILATPQQSITSTRLIYIGSEDGMETELVAQESNLPLRTIPSAALRGRAPWTMARNLMILAKGTRAAQQLIAAERPAAILGTGGYVCVPLFLAARAARIPTMIYLPDVVPGLAVQLLAQLATVVACNVEDSIKYLRPAINSLRLPVARFQDRSRVAKSGDSKIVITGYPVRRSLFDQDRNDCRAAFGLDHSSPVLFVYGGSRGARSINQAMAVLLEHLLPLTQIIHVCGREGDETFLRDAVARLPQALQVRYHLYPYLFSDEGDRKTQDHGAGGTVATPAQRRAATMIKAFGAADLAICRSGASTLAELPAARLPAVLIPYPYVHQEENADYLVRHGAAVKIRDSEMIGSRRPEEGPLFQTVRRLLQRDEERTHMSECSQVLARPHAARHLAQMLLDLAAKRGPA